MGLLVSIALGWDYFPAIIMLVPSRYWTNNPRPPYLWCIRITLILPYSDSESSPVNRIDGPGDQGFWCTENHPVCKFSYANGHFQESGCADQSHCSSGVDACDIFTSIGFLLRLSYPDSYPPGIFPSFLCKTTRHDLSKKLLFSATSFSGKRHF